MTVLIYALYIVGFLIQYIVPIVLFGNVVPYTQQGIMQTVTFAAVMAMIVAALLITGKTKEWLLNRDKSLVRGALLSAFPLGWWFIVWRVLEWTNSFVLAMMDYWSSIVIFIVIGRLLAVIAEALSAEHDKAKKDKE